LTFKKNFVIIRVRRNAIKAWKANTYI